MRAIIKEANHGVIMNMCCVQNNVKVSRLLDLFGYDI